MMIDFDELKRLVPITTVCDLIGWRPWKKEPSAWRGKCPFHASNNPKPSRSFAVSPASNGFCCQRCGVNGDQVHLFKLWGNYPTMYAAALALCRQIGINPPRLHKPERRRGTVEGGAKHGSN